MSPRKIRIHVEIYSPNDSTEYYDLPDHWDLLTPEQQDEELREMAVDELSNAAGSGATVVEVDENGKEVPE